MNGSADQKGVFFRIMIRNRWVRIGLNLLLLLLLPLFGFGAVKGYYWYQVRSAVEEFRQQLSLSATLEYGAIETGFDGVAGVRQLVLRPLNSELNLEQGTPAPSIKIDALRVKASSWLDLVRMSSRLEQGELPQALGIELSGIQVDLSSTELERLASHVVSDEAATVQWLRGCEAATAGVNGLQWLHKLGYQQLQFSITAEYAFDQSNKLLSVSLNQSVQDQYDMALNAALDLGINELNRYNLALISPSLGDINLHYADRSLAKRAIRVCAETAQETAEQFVDRHVALVTADSRALGLVLPTSLIEGYRNFLLGTGELHLELLGGRQLWPASMLQYSPDQLFEALAPKLQINGERIEPLTIGWQPDVATIEPLQQQLRKSVEAFSAMLQAPFVEPQDSTPAEVDPALLAPDSGYAQGRGYRVTELDQLQRYLGSDVRIETKNGNLIEGRLLAVEAYEMRIYQQVGLGDAVLPIIFKHVQSVQVYR